MLRVAITAKRLSTDCDELFVLREVAGRFPSVAGFLVSMFDSPSENSRSDLRCELAPRLSLHW